MTPHCDKCGGAHSPWIRCADVSFSGYVSRAGNMRDSGNLNTAEPYSSSGPNAEYADEVTTRIDAVIREDDWCGYSEETHPAPIESVPLAEQITMYGMAVEEVLDALHDNLEDEWFREAIIRLGVERLTEGYEDFGSAMYAWDADKRDDEMFQEVADFAVYGTSGDFFRVAP